MPRRPPWPRREIIPGAPAPGLGISQYSAKGTAVRLLLYTKSNRQQKRCKRYVVHKALSLFWACGFKVHFAMYYSAMQSKMLPKTFTGPGRKTARSTQYISSRMPQAVYPSAALLFVKRDNTALIIVCLKLYLTERLILHTNLEVPRASHSLSLPPS